MLVTVNNLMDPIEVIGDARVDTRHSRLPATDAPRHDPRQMPTALSLANHWTATVAFASVLPFFSPRANEARMQIERWP